MTTGTPYLEQSISCKSRRLLLGFCGSLTTFSSWQLDVFLAWAGAPPGRSQWHIVSAATPIIIVFQYPIAVLGWLESPYHYPSYIYGISRLRTLAHYD
jgi:fluoride ion exporter CrcB/FEX